MNADFMQKNHGAPNEVITMHLTRLNAYRIFINITDFTLCIETSVITYPNFTNLI